VWSHAAWTNSLGVDVPLLSDWNGEAIRAFGVSMEPLGMADVAKRSSFLVEDGRTIVESWMLGPELPDIDAVIAATSG
jgi:peroxiredoxin